MPKWPTIVREKFSDGSDYSAEGNQARSSQTFVNM